MKNDAYIKLVSDIRAHLTGVPASPEALYDPAQSEILRRCRVVPVTALPVRASTRFDQHKTSKGYIGLTLAGFLWREYGDCLAADPRHWQLGMMTRDYLRSLDGSACAGFEYKALYGPRVKQTVRDELAGIYLPALHEVHDFLLANAELANAWRKTNPSHYHGALARRRGAPLSL